MNKIVSFFRPKFWSCKSKFEKVWWFIGLPIRIVLAGFVGLMAGLILPLELVVFAVKGIVRQEVN